MKRQEDSPEEEPENLEKQLQQYNTHNPTRMVIRGR